MSQKRERASSKPFKARKTVLLSSQSEASGRLFRKFEPIPRRGHLHADGGLPATVHWYWARRAPGDELGQPVPPVTLKKEGREEGEGEEEEHD